MARIPVLFLFALSAQSMRIAVVYTLATPFNVPQTMESAIQCTAFQGILTLHLVSKPTELDELGADIVLDYSYDEEIAEKLSTGDMHLRTLRMWHTQVWDSGKQYEDQFSQYLRAMNFSRVLILTNSDLHNLALATSLFHSSPDLYRDVSVLPTNVTKSVLLRVVGREIKPRGINLVAVLLSAEETVRFLEAAEEKKLDKAGYAFILSQEAGLYRFSPHSLTGLQASGAVIISDSVGTAATREEFEAVVLAQQLRLLTGNDYAIEASRDISAWARKPQVALLSMNNSQASVAAVSPTEVSSSTRIQFPGNTTAFPDLQKAKIRALVNYQLPIPDKSLSPLLGPAMRGFYVAFREANNRTDLIPDYYLEDFAVDFTGIDFNYTLSKSRLLRHLPNRGIIYMATPVSQCVIGMTHLFAEFNISMPMSTGSIGTELSDPKAFPLFLRPRVSNRYMSLITARMVQYFGWQRVAVLYEADGGSNEDAYQQWMVMADTFGINVTNSEGSRRLPTTLNSNNAAVLNASLQEIQSSTTRIILIMHHYNFVIMERMYDLEMFEYLQVYMSMLSSVLFADSALYKRRKVSKGALMFMPSLFVGAVGQRVLHSLIDIDGSNLFVNTCFYYDSSYLFLYALQYLLERGLDYEDPVVLVKAMRETYFQGCGGFIKIETGTNDRAASEVSITNFQYDSENDTFQLKVVGKYNPFSTQPYQFTSAIQWPVDEESFADLKPQYRNCPFLEELVREVAIGRNLGLALEFTVVFVTLIATIVIWRKWWRVPGRILRKKEPISIEDVLALLTACCDCLQLLSLGPDFSHISSFAAKVTAIIGFNFPALLSMEAGVYWLVLDLTLAAVGLWMLLCVLKLTETDALLWRLCKPLEYWVDLLLPALSNLLFLPILSILASVFLCYRGISDSLTDTFLNTDCSEFCWRKRHLGYAAGCAVALLCYIPLAVFTRPLWQEMQENVHVKFRPQGLLQKSAVQAFLIASANALRSDFPLTHTFLFFSTISAYILSISLRRQSNYDRLNLWQALMMVAVLSTSVAGFISQGLPHAEIVKVQVALTVEVAALAAVGAAVQVLVKRFESKVISLKKMDVRGLYVFAFTRGHRAQKGLTQFYSDNRLTAHRVPGSSVDESYQ